MHCIRILGLVVLLVGYCRAGSIASVRSVYSLGDEYDETSEVKKSVEEADLHSTLPKPFRQIESPKKPQVESKPADAKMEEHSHDEETDGTNISVARFYGHVSAPFGGGSLSGGENGTFRSAGNWREDEPKEDDEDIYQ